MGSQRTIQQLIDEDEIILDGFFVKLAEIASPQLDQPVQKLKHERSIGIALGNGHQVDVFVLHMTKCSAPKRQDWRPDLGIGDDLDPEHIGEARSTVIPKGSKD